jgi:integrase
MSVHKDRDAWRVKYRDSADVQRSRSFKLKGDADRFDLEMKRRLQLGPVLARELDRNQITLEQFIATGFRTHAATLSRDTRRHYAWACKNHLDELMPEPLIMLDVPRLAAHQAHLLDEGRTPSTIRQAITRLSGILQVAVEHGHLPANPARAVRKVPAEPRPEVRPLAPVELEALLDRFDGRGRAVVLLGGYFGLRPKEIRSAVWSRWDGRALTISRAATKLSAARTRVIPAPAAAIPELNAWRLESGGRGEDQIVPMTRKALALWCERHLIPAAADIGRPDVTLYTLRHTHASALHYCGFTVPAAARRMGHGAPLHLTTYAHVIDALEGQPRYGDLDELIAAARAERSAGVPPTFRKAGETP